MYRAMYKLSRGNALPKTREDQETAQADVLAELLSVLPATSYGSECGAVEVADLPVRSYEEFYPWIERAWNGEADVLWHGTVEWFAKSSGTTNARSKFIPVSSDAMEQNHFLCGRDMLASYLERNPDSRLGFDSVVTISGSVQDIHPVSGAKAGDVSAVLDANAPWWADLAKTLPKDILNIPAWKDRFPKAIEFLKDADVKAFVGTVTWVHLLLSEAVAKYGAKDALELWPELEVFFHGAVSMSPYRAQFEKLIPAKTFRFVEVYNASEGFFAFQDTDNADNGMLLLCGHGIYYEFRDLKTGVLYPLQKVKKGERYEMIISTVAGLWRYTIGDVVEIVNDDPVRVRVVGRTKAMLNAYGEELMVGNVDEALSRLKDLFPVPTEYTGCPVYKTETAAGAHEWIMEFDEMPSCDEFVRAFDAELRSLNSDYDAKRSGDIVLGLPIVHFVPKGTFYHWMERRGKFGGQNKIPRLSESRSHVEEILALISQSGS